MGGCALKPTYAGTSASIESFVAEPREVVFGAGDQLILVGEELGDLAVDLPGAGDVAFLLVELTEPQVDRAEEGVLPADVGLDEALGLLRRQVLLEHLIDPRAGSLGAGRPRPGVGAGPDVEGLHVAAVGDVGVRGLVELL